MDKITSKNNNLIKDTKKLFTSSKYRYEKGMLVLEGARLCFDVLNCICEVEYILFTEDMLKKYGDKISQLSHLSKCSFVITPEISEKLSETKSPQGIFACVKMPPKRIDDLGKKIIILDNVQDPSNVGAIIRSAEALGIDTIITYQGCDIYNPKAIRSSMGGVLRMNICNVDDLCAELKALKSKGYMICSTVPDNNAMKITEIDFSLPSVCVIGNEANGVEDEIKAASDLLITIPMLGRAESLNASVAASITMWEMLR